MDASGQEVKSEERTSNVGTQGSQIRDKVIVAIDPTEAGAGVCSTKVWPDLADQAPSELTGDGPNSAGAPKVSKSLASDSGVGGPSDTLLYRAGVRHGSADFLSRMPPKQGDVAEEFAEYITPKPNCLLSKSSIEVAQLTDQRCIRDQSAYLKALHRTLEEVEDSLHLFKIAS